MNEIMKEMNTIKIEELQNKELKKITNRIYTIGDKINSYKLELARHFVNVENKGLYKQDGFKDFTKWSEAMFGFKKTQSYELYKIGNSFIVEEVDDKGRITYHSKFKTANGDYSFTQLVRMYAFQSEHGKDRLLEYIANGDININTSASAIQQLSRDLKALKAPTENKEEKQEAKDNKEEKQEAKENKEENKEEKQDATENKETSEESNVISGMIQSDPVYGNQIVTIKLRGDVFNVDYDELVAFLLENTK